tara:strand:- start:208 stop:495 length:288 start_codon:yes stop_codon:yes gene_type:complete
MRTELGEVILGGHRLMYCNAWPVFTWYILPPPSIEPPTLFKRSIGEDVAKCESGTIYRLSVLILQDTLCKLAHLIIVNPKIHPMPQKAFVYFSQV